MIKFFRFFESEKAAKGVASRIRSKYRSARRRDQVLAAHVPAGNASFRRNPCAATKKNQNPAPGSSTELLDRTVPRREVPGIFQITRPFLRSPVSLVEDALPVFRDMRSRRASSSSKKESRGEKIHARGSEFGLRCNGGVSAVCVGLSRSSLLSRCIRMGHFDSHGPAG
jgi:hypothetical protein